jgi:hypothetical protein
MVLVSFNTNRGLCLKLKNFPKPEMKFYLENNNGKKLIIAVIEKQRFSISLQGDNKENWTANLDFQNQLIFKKF